MPTRRAALLGTIAAMAVSALPACTGNAPGGAAGAAVAPQDRPNIIVIETDDMRVDDLAAMPQTRQLLGGTNGARYTHSYASTPLCCPSRAALLTGQYAHNNGVLNNSGPTGGVDELRDAETLPVWLQRSGYHTAMFGKYLNGYGDPSDGTAPDYVPPGWSTWNVLSYASRSDYTDFSYVVGSSGPNAPSTTTGAHTEVDGYQTRKFTSLAQNEIKDTADPIFVWLSLYAPHRGKGDGGQQYVPAEPQYAGDSTVGLPDSPAVNEPNVGDKPPWVRNLPLLSDTQKSQIITERRERRDALRTVDDSVARIVDALQVTGELSNSVIIFTSDNGYMLGEHRIQKGKTFPYSESAEVPLLIRGPGFSPGTHTAPVSNVDLAPTIVDLANAAPGVVMDGRSLLNPISQDRPILLENPDAFDPSRVPSYSGVIQGVWEDVMYDGGRELYDLVDDPWQLQNKAGSPALAAKRKKLDTLVRNLRDCAGKECRP